MKIYTFRVFWIKNTNFSKIKRANCRHQVSRLHSFNECFKCCSDFKWALNENDLFDIPCVHKLFVYSLKPEYRWYLLELLLLLSQHFCGFTQHHHYLNVASLEWSRAKLRNIVKFHLQLVLFQYAIRLLVREIDENGVILLNFLINLVSMKIINGNMFFLPEGA